MTAETDSSADKFERRLTLGIVVLNLLITTVAGFFLVGRYEARMHQATEALTLKDIELREIELEFKQHREQTQLSSDTLTLIDKLIPKVELKHIKKDSKSNKRNHYVMHSFKNVGALSITIDSFKVVLTTKKYGRDDTPIGPLKEGRDYKVRVQPFSSGQLPAESQVFFGASIELMPHILKKHNHVYATLFIYYRTHPSLSKIVKPQIEKWVGVKAFENIVSARSRSATRLVTR